MFNIKINNNFCFDENYLKNEILNKPIYFSDATYLHWMFDFKLTDNAWVEIIKISNCLKKFEVNIFYN